MKKKFILLMLAVLLIIGLCYGYFGLWLAEVASTFLGSGTVTYERYRRGNVPCHSAAIPLGHYQFAGLYTPESEACSPSYRYRPAVRGEGDIFDQVLLGCSFSATFNQMTVSTSSAPITRSFRLGPRRPPVVALFGPKALVPDRLRARADLPFEFYSANSSSIWAVTRLYPSSPSSPSQW
jgi:hypothetical protein